MVLNLILFLVGLALLVKGADFLVDGSASLARRMGVSSLIVGLTVVAFGTSAPELVVSLLAAIRGTSDIAIGNVIGSNTANILLILGLSAVVFPMSVKIQTVWKEIPFALLAVILVWLLALDGSLSFSDGLILIFLFAGFLYYIYRSTRKISEDEGEARIFSIQRSWLFIILGLAGLVGGGSVLVRSAVNIAESLGVSQALIGLTIVAVGTSLPELATSVVAAYKKNTDIAVGNIVGSNIFNVFWILGLTSIITPLPFLDVMRMDTAVSIIASLLLFAAMFVRKRHIMERWQGVLFVLFYILYIIYLIFRG